MITNLKNQLKSNPTNVKVLNELITLLFKDEMYDEVIIYGINLSNLIEKAVIVDTSIIFNTYLTLGISFVRMARYDEAINFIILCLAYYPNRDDLLLLQGECDYRRGNFVRAQETLNKCVKNMPNDLSAKKIYGLVLCELKQYKNALNYLVLVFNSSLKDMEVGLKLAICYEETRDFNMALKLFIFMHKDPIYGAEACLHAGKIFYNEKNYSKAISLFMYGSNNVVNTSNLYLELQFSLSQAYLKNSNYIESLELLKQIKISNPYYIKTIDHDIEILEDVLENKLFATYLNGTSSQFTALAQSMVAHIFLPKKARINTTIVENDIYCDYLANITDHREVLNYYVRLYRVHMPITESQLTEVNNKMREYLATNATVIAPSGFSDQALEFTKLRPLNLLAKKDLFKVLSRIR